MPRPIVRSLTALAVVLVAVVALTAVPSAQPKSDGKVYVGHGFSISNTRPASSTSRT
jgi:hypothetical protein